MTIENRREAHGYYPLIQLKVECKSPEQIGQE